MTGDSIVTLLAENVQPRRGRTGWHGGPTPVGALRGVTHETARWVPASGRKSIWELALHIAYWKYAVRRRLEGTTDRGRFPRSPANFPAVAGEASAREWAEDVALLRSEHQRLVEAVSAIPSRRYGIVLPGRRRWTIGELIVGIAQHDAYHTGQIQLMKRLWQANRGRRRAR